MSRVQWRDASAKMIVLVERLPMEFRGAGVRGLARYVAAGVKLGDGDKAVSVETIRSELSKCQSDVGDTSEISAKHIGRIMHAFGLCEAADGEWFIKGAKEDFTEGMDRATARAARYLRLRSLQPREVWNDELRSDVSAVQGHPMGLVVAFSGRTLNYGAKNYAYGFSRVAVAIELRGSDTLRFEFDERARAGYEDNDFKLVSRGVPTRPEFEISTLSKGPIEGYFHSDSLGELVGAKVGDKLLARTRVERKDGVLVYSGPTPPSKTRAEIIACVFGEDLKQFATLSTQEIRVEDCEEGDA